MVCAHHMWDAHILSDLCFASPSNMKGAPSPTVDTLIVGELTDDPAPSDSAELSTWYRRYVIYECILVNLVGFITLFFQCDLQRLEAVFLVNHPYVPQKEADTIFGHFWLSGNLNCEDDAAHCLTKMVCGWLMIAGLLQVECSLKYWYTLNRPTNHPLTLSVDGLRSLSTSMV